MFQEECLRRSARPVAAPAGLVAPGLRPGPPGPGREFLGWRPGGMGAWVFMCVWGPCILSSSPGFSTTPSDHFVPAHRKRSSRTCPCFSQSRTGRSMPEDLSRSEPPACMSEASAANPPRVGCRCRRRVAESRMARPLCRTGRGRDAAVAVLVITLMLWPHAGSILACPPARFAGCSPLRGVAVAAVARSGLHPRAGCSPRRVGDAWNGW